MTYALAQVSELVAVALALRSSLKCLKGLSASTSQKGILVDGRATDQLMFWVVFAILSMYEKYLEFILRWIPGYYYAKFFYILSITFPQLKITNLIFWDFWVVLVNNAYKLLIDESSKTLYDTALDVPFILLLLIFPALGKVQIEKNDRTHILLDDALFDELIQNSTTSSDPNPDRDKIANNSEIIKQKIKIVSYKTDKKEEKEIKIDGVTKCKIRSQSLGLGIHSTSNAQNGTDNLSDGINLNFNAKTILALCQNPLKKEMDTSKEHSLSPPTDRTPITMKVITVKTPPISYTTPSNLMSSVSPRSMKDVKEDTLRRLSTLTAVVKCLNPRFKTREISPMSTRKIRTDSPMRSITNSSKKCNTFSFSDNIDSEYEDMNPTDDDKNGKNEKNGKTEKNARNEKNSNNLRSRRCIMEKEKMKHGDPHLIRNSDKIEKENPVGVDNMKIKEDKSMKLNVTLSKAKSLRSSVTSLFDLDLTHKPLNSAARNRRRDTLGMEMT